MVNRRGRFSGLNKVKTRGEFVFLLCTSVTRCFSASGPLVSGRLPWEMHPPAMWMHSLWYPERRGALASVQSANTGFWCCFSHRQHLFKLFLTFAVRLFFVPVSSSNLSDASAVCTSPSLPHVHAVCSYSGTPSVYHAFVPDSRISLSLLGAQRPVLLSSVLCLPPF